MIEKDQFMKKQGLLLPQSVFFCTYAKEDLKIIKKNTVVLLESRLLYF